MSFNSLEYLIFLGIVCGLFYLFPDNRVRKWLLLLESLFFYFCWDYMAGFLLMGTSLLTWICGMQIGKTEQIAKRRMWMSAACTVTLGSLFFFKYGGVLFAGKTLFLPAGISFYTFQTLAYVLDIYHKRAEPEKSFTSYTLFVSFFPQLVAGPIERTGQLLPQLKQFHRPSTQERTDAFWFLLSGYFHKVVIADQLAPWVDRVFADYVQASGFQILFATVLFGVQIYCDFYGYSEIARGSALLLGIRLSANFRHPYRAQSIQDFWHRWHISLTKWFTDYVYIPLGGNQKGTLRQIGAIALVFLLSGLWHGVGWHFVAWGAIHAIYQISERLGQRSLKEFHAPRWMGNMKQIRVFLLVTFAWLFFRAESLQAAFQMLMRLGEGWMHPVADFHELMWLLFLLGSFVISERLPDDKNQIPESFRALMVFYTVLAILFVGLYQLTSHGENAFIYFQF